MATTFYVKYCEREKKDAKAELAGEFNDVVEAEQYKSKLINGGAGLFGILHDVWIDAIPVKLGKQNDERLKAVHK